MSARTRSHGGLRDPELHRDRIRRPEPDAPDVPREPVQVLRHHLRRVGAVGPEYPHRPRRADAVAVQEHHDLADNLLLGPGIRDPLRPHLADTGHLAQPPIYVSMPSVEDGSAVRMKRALNC